MVIISSLQVTLQRDIALFLTASPAWLPPPSLSSFIRVFSFPLPDNTMVVRAHCIALGLKAPKALANKLVTLQNMAREQL